MANEHTVTASVVGETLTLRVGNVEKAVNIQDINKSYLLREFARGVKLRIDNAAAGVEGEGKLSAKLKMVELINWKDPTGGISGGSRKESGEAFLARVKDGIEDLEGYQGAVADAQANVRKSDLSDVLVELSTLLPELIG